jgi:hypothetical protein
MQISPPVITVQHVYNDHPRDQKFVALLTGGHSLEVALCHKIENGAPKRWSL